MNYQDRAFNRSAGEYANLADASYFESPKILVRRTGDYVMAVFDPDGFYASNNLFVVLPQKSKSSLSLPALSSVLNSKLMTWYFRTIQPRVGKVFAELKINQLHKFPLPEVEGIQKRDRALEVLAGKMTALMPAFRTAKTDKERASIQNALTRNDQEIDQLYHLLNTFRL